MANLHNQTPELDKLLSKQELISDGSRLEALTKLVQNPIFKELIDNLRKLKFESINAIVNTTVDGLGTVLIREQVIGEVRGYEALELDVEQLLTGLRELVSGNSNKEGENNEVI